MSLDIKSLVYMLGHTLECTRMLNDVLLKLLPPCCLTLHPFVFHQKGLATNTRRTQVQQNDFTLTLQSYFFLGENKEKRLSMIFFQNSWT